MKLVFCWLQQKWLARNESVCKFSAKPSTRRFWTVTAQVTLIAYDKLLNSAEQVTVKNKSTWTDESPTKKTNRLLKVCPRVSQTLRADIK